MNGDDMTKLRGQSPEFLRVLHTARILATTETPVLIIGEQGVGKETLAREIHRSSGQRGRPFFNLICAGLTGDALTGMADESSSDGPLATGGTLYFNEIGDLSTEGQAKLFNLTEQIANRLGGAPSVRLIASSSRDLRALVDQGVFREDLYFRLYVVPLELPPLRHRGGDVAFLLKQFTVDMARAYGRKAPAYSVSAKNLLKAYHWPGNLRELRNFCERMVLLFPGATVQPENLPIEIRRGRGTGTRSPGFLLPDGGIDLFSLEADMIGQALRMAGGNRSKAARLLGLSRDTLLYRMQKYAIKA